MGSRTKVDDRTRAVVERGEGVVVVGKAVHAATNVARAVVDDCERAVVDGGYQGAAKGWGR